MCMCEVGGGLFRFGKCNSTFLHRLIVLDTLDYLHAHISINPHDYTEVDARISSRCQYAINWSARVSANLYAEYDVQKLISSASSRVDAGKQ